MIVTLQLSDGKHRKITQLVQTTQLLIVGMDINPCILIQEPKILNLHIPKESGSSLSQDEMFFYLRHTYVSPLFYKKLLCVLLYGHMFLPLDSEYSNRTPNFQVELDTVSGVYPNCILAIFLVSVFSLFSEAPKAA